MPKVLRIWQTAAIIWHPLVRSRYVVALHCVCPFCKLESEDSFFIPYNADTLPQNCSWSCKEHRRLEGQASEQLYRTTRLNLKRKGRKKATSTAGHLPFISGVSTWGCRFHLLAGCHSLPTASTFNTSNVTIKSFIQNMSDSIIVRDDEISCSPDPAWRDDLTLCSKVTDYIH